MKVRVNSRYTYDPVPLDRIDPPLGVIEGSLRPGDVVTVINLPGCPKANVMNHCYIATDLHGFAGLVHTNSLRRSA